MTRLLELLRSVRPKVIGAFALRSGVGVALTLLLAAAGVGLDLNLSAVSLLYLLLVVSYAVRFGFWQASVISVAALACQDYYFTTPRYSFYISHRRDAVAVVVFQAIALLVSRVSTREKAYAIEAERKRRTMEQLYAISRGALLLDMNQPPERNMAELIQTELRAQAVAIANLSSGSIGAAGMQREEAAEQIRRLSAGIPQTEPSAQTSLRVLLNANRQLGTLLVVGEVPPLAIDSLASLVALTLDRHQAFVNKGIAEAARQTEQLRTTVLEGLAHAFKTPLTIIRAASSGLIEIGQMDELQGQLTQMIDEQSTRLDDLATRLLRTARVDGAKICLESEAVSIPNLIQEVVAEFRGDWAEFDQGAASSPPINVATRGNSLHLIADHEMLASTLKELLNNAAKYSRPGSPIDVTAAEHDAELVISVRSQGTPIQMEDRERIFETFYRGAQQRDSAPGTGIGLSVARRVTEAHGGQIWVVSNEADGTTFHMSLPRQVA